MAVHKRPPRLSPKQTEALLARIANLAGATPQPSTTSQSPRQQSYAGWSWEDGADPYLPTGT